MKDTKTRGTKKDAPRKRKLPGRDSLFRRKVRAPMSILLTPGGHDYMAHEVERTSLSYSDHAQLAIRLGSPLIPSTRDEQEHLIKTKGWAE